MKIDFMLKFSICGVEASAWSAINLPFQTLVKRYMWLKDLMDSLSKLIGLLEKADLP